MINHLKVFLKFWKLSIGEFIPCWYCGGEAVDIHHLEGRKAGGSKLKDFPANLFPCCRTCHIRAENNKEFNEKLKEILKRKIYERDKGGLL